jgi:hypothetical protein
MMDIVVSGPVDNSIRIVNTTGCRRGLNIDAFLTVFYMYRGGDY